VAQTSWDLLVGQNKGLCGANVGRCWQRAIAERLGCLQRTRYKPLRPLPVKGRQTDKHAGAVVCPDTLGERERGKGVVGRGGKTRDDTRYSSKVMRASQMMEGSVFFSCAWRIILAKHAGLHTCTLPRA
jgi:hypothetical protein